MVDKTTQDRLEIFKGSLKNGKLDWQIYLQLEDRQADAIWSMLEAKVLTEEKDGNYEVKAIIGRINVPARDLEYSPERIPLYFKDRTQAEQVAEFYRTNDQKVTVTKNRGKKRN